MQPKVWLANVGSSFPTAIVCQNAQITSTIYCLGENIEDLRLRLVAI